MKSIKYIKQRRDEIEIKELFKFLRMFKLEAKLLKVKLNKRNEKKIHCNLSQMENELLPSELLGMRKGDIYRLF